ncbi:MAG TPA: TIM-barrel domain-containing protein [Candidatus Binatia bacterium]|nr:TIM-barrel domain-containing protein [Candidatus Binatia bacterium]
MRPAIASSALRLAFVFALAAGCGDATPTHTAPTTALRVSESGEIGLLRDGVTLAVLEPDAVRLGVVDEVSERENYDPQHLVTGGAGVPEGFHWSLPTDVRVVAGGTERAQLDLAFADEISAALAIERAGDGRFAGHLKVTAGASRVAYEQLRVRVDSAEAFYGLGESFDQVNQRGKLRAMQIELDPGIESSNNEAHVPVPFFVGTRGWGLFVATSYPATFDMAAADPERVEISVGTALASAGGLDFHWFAAAHPLDVTRQYYEVTGTPKLPAPWALGPWIWRNEVAGEDAVLDDATMIRELDLATTGYWIDRPYASAVNSFDFDPARYGDPRAMIARLRDLGLRVALWHTPYLEDKPANQALLAEATAGGWFPNPAGLLLLNDWSMPIDFTSAAAREFWQAHLRFYTELGIEGFKLDYGEDVVAGLPGIRSPWGFADGSDERTMHADYQRFYHRVYAEVVPEDGGFLLCRAGTWGDQVNGPIIWPGDLDATLARHREPAEDGGERYVSVGGLPAAINASLTLGPSGFPFFGSDTGGFRHDPPDEETFTRWFEHTALSTVMQVGTGSNLVPWEWDRFGYSPAVLERYRRYARLHLRLWPYLWTHATRLAEDGRPIQRALGLAHPELGLHPNDVYLLGDDLLVAPVVERGATAREVPLPAGGWIDWWTGERHEGGGTIVVDAPLDTLPLFLREGGIVPLLRPTIDTLSPVADRDAIDSYATDPGVLYARAVPGDQRSSFALFDGSRIEIDANGRPRFVAGEEFRAGAVVELWQDGAFREVFVPPT